MVFSDHYSRIDQAADQWRLVRGRLAQGETIRLVVRSGSMLPLMPVGDEIEIAPVRGTNCRAGDVVVFLRDDRLIAHRLLLGWNRGDRGWFLERGDGHSPAAVLRTRDILGRVVAIHHADGGQQRLDGPAAQASALRQARRSLFRPLRGMLTAPLRKVKRWLRRDSTGSA